jgi:cell wall-associated NlpC family hydrolase
MRYSFLLILIGCSLVNCKNESATKTTFDIPILSGFDLSYPDQAHHINVATQQKFKEIFFLPWNINPKNALLYMDSVPGKDLTFLQKYLDDDQWFGENKKPHTESQRAEIVGNVSLDGFPNFVKKGIVISHTNLRRIPTIRPGFDTYSHAGEGFPFDYFQETNLWANTPVLILHITQDGQWCYLISPYYKGWVYMHDLAVVSDQFINEWQTDLYAMPLSDKVSLKNADSHYAVTAKLGMVIPYESTSEPGSVNAYYVNADENQNAHLLRAPVDISQFATDQYAFSGENLKHLIAQLEGRPYGWGGYLENRDCSSMIRDLMATFKIWLPRDSGDQINIGTQYELTGSLNEKLERIKDYAIPFRTIFRKKGHNMLYVGDNASGEPLIFHAIWGLKTTYSNPQLTDYIKEYPIEGLTPEEDGTVTGRYIFGEAVITSVLAGSGNSGITNPILEDIYAMTVVLE